MCAVWQKPSDSSEQSIHSWHSRRSKYIEYRIYLMFIKQTKSSTMIKLPRDMHDATQETKGEYFRLLASISSIVALFIVVLKLTIFWCYIVDNCFDSYCVSTPVEIDYCRIMVSLSTVLCLSESLDQLVHPCIRQLLLWEMKMETKDLSLEWALILSPWIPTTAVDKCLSQFQWNAAPQQFFRRADYH